jgi:serine/threonine protein kinase
MTDEKKEKPATTEPTEEHERTVLFEPSPATDIPSGIGDSKNKDVAKPPQGELSITSELENDDDLDDRTILISDTHSRQTNVNHGIPDPKATSIGDKKELEIKGPEDPNSVSNVDPVPSVPTQTKTPIPFELGEPLSSLEIGTIINNMYLVVEQLNQGGMGRVFRGEEIGTGEPVAIKVILPEMAEDEKVAAMVKREARTLRQLHHDAIVRYFAYVPPDQNLNLHALVMGFIEGTTLSDTVKNGGALTREQVIKLTLRLADGLEGAHKVGVIHRDLSPDNVMLENGEIDKAVLIDFGISRSSTVKDVTIGNEFAGKLKYVSPEQLGAFGGEAGAPSDVYSLGLLMIVMLTGKPLSMGASIVDAVQMRQSVPNLSNIHPEFRNLLEKMLQPDPSQRLPSMRDIIEELCSLDGVSSLSGSLMRSTSPPTSIADHAVPGLQAVPFTARGGGLEAERESKNADRPTEVKKSGQRAVLQIVSTLAVIALVLFIYFFKEELLLSNVTMTDSVENDPMAEGLKRIEGTHETFLAEAISGSCSYAALRKHGPNAEIIEVFSENLSPLRNIGNDFGAQFDTSSETKPRSTPSVHCSLLNLANTFQGTRGSTIELSLKKNTLSISNGVEGTLHGSLGRRNWLALVDPNGKIYSLMKNFDEPIGNERKFDFRFNGAQPGIYIVFATASDKTLVRSGAMKNGTTTEDFVPLLMRELALDGRGAIDISYLELTR